jgi:hypothetical protein
MLIVIAQFFIGNRKFQFKLASPVFEGAFSSVGKLHFVNRGYYLYYLFELEEEK